MKQQNIVKVFYDLETTGVNPKRNSIHQIAMIIEIDEQVVEEINFKVAPHPKAEIEEGAMRVCGVTAEQIKTYPPMKEVYKNLIQVLRMYVDAYDPKQKIHLVGFNNRQFDDIFLRAWFEQNGDDFFNSWFWSDSLDVIVLASEYLLARRVDMPSFKLKRVAKEVGLVVKEKELHDALYDVRLTRDIYRIVTRRELEI